MLSVPPSPAAIASYFWKWRISSDLTGPPIEILLAPLKSFVFSISLRPKRENMCKKYLMIKSNYNLQRKCINPARKIPQSAPLNTKNLLKVPVDILGIFWQRHVEISPFLNRYTELFLKMEQLSSYSAVPVAGPGDGVLTVRVVLLPLSLHILPNISTCGEFFSLAF
jgi:hypothetical protein